MLLVNISWANPIENHEIEEMSEVSSDRVKRAPPCTASVRFSSSGFSSAKKTFIKGKVQTLMKNINVDSNDSPDNGRSTQLLASALISKYGGKWIVMGCEDDEYCSLSNGFRNFSKEYTYVDCGEVDWMIFRV